MTPDTHTLRIEAQNEPDGTQRLVLAGDIDEQADLSSIKMVTAGVVVLDLAGVERINSIGVRDWINAMKQIPTTVELWWDRVSPAMVMQLNMIANFNGHARLRSIYAPYYCPRCDSEHRFLLKVSDIEANDPPAAPRFSCPQCEQHLEFDDIEADYFGALLDAVKA